MRTLIGKLPVLFMLWEPPPAAAVPFTVSAPPVGAVTSRTRLKLDEMVRLTLLYAVTVFEPESDELDQV